MIWWKNWLKKHKARRLVKSLDELIGVMGKSDEKRWLPGLRVLRAEVAADQTGLTDAARRVFRTCSGGMGSFNDLVLYRNGQLDRELNKRFQQAKIRLHRAAVACLGE